jgi:hypothetical protein
MSTCTNCGANLAQGTIFCQSCGARQDAQPQPQYVAPQPQPQPQQQYVAPQPQYVAPAPQPQVKNEGAGLNPAFFFAIFALIPITISIIMLCLAGYHYITMLSASILSIISLAGLTLTFTKNASEQKLTMPARIMSFVALGLILTHDLVLFLMQVA